MNRGKLVEAAYLVHLDIRPVALVHCQSRPFTVEELDFMREAASTYDDVIFAVAVYYDNRHFALYSKYQWAIDMYQYADQMSHDHEHALRGLLHGIPARNVQDFLDRCNNERV